MVILGHVYRNSNIVDWIYSFHMPLFFFAAGYVYRAKPVNVDARRRFHTIILPYFVFGALELVYWALIERRFRDSDMTIPQAVIGLFRGEYSQLDFNQHLWFLPCFFMTVVLFNAVNVSSRKMGIIYAYGISIVLSIVYLIDIIPSLPWGLDRVCKFIGFFAFGVLSSSISMRYRDKLQGLCSRLPKTPCNVVKIAMGIALLSLVFYLAQIVPSRTIMWYVNGILGIAGTVLISMIVDCSLFQYFGKSSIIILCLHGPIYRVLIKVESILLGISTEDVRESILLVISIIILTLLLCSIVYQIVIKYVPWIIGRKQSV